VFLLQETQTCCDVLTKQDKVAVVLQHLRGQVEEGEIRQ
jgi:hypothetical protein